MTKQSNPITDPICDTNSMDLLAQVVASIEDYNAKSQTRAIYPSAQAIAQLDQLPAQLPLDGLPADQILDLLTTQVAPATVLSNSGSYFGFVTGASLPAATAANMIATNWDQNTALAIMSPAATHLEQVALAWIAQLLNIPDTATGTFVTGATMANFTGMAAARHKLLKDRGHNAETDGLFSAPAFPVVVG
ncbi:MAG: pyridoxal-dependent decarboxylase, partial [Chloroflexia bacterium]